MALKLQPRGMRMRPTLSSAERRMEACERSETARNWFALRTKPKKEEFAVLQLERRGVHCYLPWVLEYRREQVAPLFPGYLFVRIDLLSQYHRVIWTPGVRLFVAFGDVPAVVPESVIQLIRSSAGPDGVIRPRCALRPGDRVEITGGPLAGLVAVIEQPCSERGRVKVLLDFLRHGATVELSVDLVDRV